MRQSIFERCGGFATVRKIISDFYEKVMNSPALERHFVDVDMRALIDHQTKFVASVMGGPASFSDDVLRRVHEPLGVTRTEFLEAADLLRETLEDYDLAPEDVAAVYKEIMKRELLIVSR